MSGGTNGMNMETKYIFCDESRQDLLASKKSITETNEYICIGGIMIPAHRLGQVKADILELRKKYNVYGELKWGTVTRGKLGFYLDIIKYFFNDDDISSIERFLSSFSYLIPKPPPRFKVCKCNLYSWLISF